MKKLIITLTVITVSLAANAQDNFEPFKDRQFIFDSLNICAALSVIYLLSNFILRIIKQSFDFKLKNRIIDKETGETLTAQLLKPDSNKDSRKYILQWVFMLAAIGIGVIAILVLCYGLYAKLLKDPPKRTPEMAREEMRKAMEKNMNQGAPRGSGAPGMQMGSGGAPR